MNPANNIAKNVFFMIELPGWCGNLPRGFACPTDGPDNLHDPYQSPRPRDSAGHGGSIRVGSSPLPVTEHVGCHRHDRECGARTVMTFASAPFAVPTTAANRGAPPAA